jgi:hypothetical protein
MTEHKFIIEITLKHEEVGKEIEKNKPISKPNNINPNDLNNLIQQILPLIIGNSVIKQENKVTK